MKPEHIQDLTDALAKIAKDTAREQVSAMAHIIGSQQSIITIIVHQLLNKGLLDRDELRSELKRALNSVDTRKLEARIPYDQLIALLEGSAQH